jgi:hypothetical protein
MANPGVPEQSATIGSGKNNRAIPTLGWASRASGAQKSIALIILVGSTLLAGCVSVPALPLRPEMQTVTSYAAAAALAPAVGDERWPEADWWRA